MTWGQAVEQHTCTVVSTKLQPAWVTVNTSRDRDNNAGRCVRCLSSQAWTPLRHHWTHNSSLVCNSLQVGQPFPGMVTLHLFWRSYLWILDKNSHKQAAQRWRQICENVITTFKIKDTQYSECATGRLCLSSQMWSHQPTSAELSRLLPIGKQLLLTTGYPQASCFWIA